MKLTRLITLSMLTLMVCVPLTVDAKKFKNEVSTGGGITIPKGLAGAVDLSSAPERKTDKYPL